MKKRCESEGVLEGIYSIMKKSLYLVWEAGRWGWGSGRNRSRLRTRWYETSSPTCLLRRRRYYNPFKVPSPVSLYICQCGVSLFYLFIDLSVCICSYICLFICCLSISVHLPLCLSLFICLCLYLFICLSICIISSVYSSSSLPVSPSMEAYIQQTSTFPANGCSYPLHVSPVHLCIEKSRNFHSHFWWLSSLHTSLGSEYQWNFPLSVYPGVLLSVRFSS